MAPTHTIPSLSGTFGIHTWLTHRPKMPKEPSSPSRSNTQKERQRINERIDIKMNQGQRTTMCIVHKGFRGFRAASSASILFGNLIGLKPAIPYDTIHSTLCGILKKRAHAQTARLVFAATKAKP
jgi:hypothetical protein